MYGVNTQKYKPVSNHNHHNTYQTFANKPNLLNGQLAD